MTAPVLITAEEAAQLLRVSPKTIYKWAASDPTFPAFRYRSVVRVNRDRFLRWVEAHEQGRRRAQPTMDQVRPLEVARTSEVA